MKTILVTGANRGIGLEICRQLSESGHRIILTSRDEAQGIAAAASLKGNVIAKQLDVTSELSIKKLYNDLNSMVGSLDVLINNAGVGTGSETYRNNRYERAKLFVKSKLSIAYSPLRRLMPLVKKTGVAGKRSGALDIEITSVRAIMDTNLYGPWMMIQTFIPMLEKSDDAQIINISSGMGSFSQLSGHYSGYSLSKYALNALTIMLTDELKAKGIRINAMCPGWVKTRMGGPNAPLNVSEGADTAVWLVNSEQKVNGKFLKGRKVIDW